MACIPHTLRRISRPIFSTTGVECKRRATRLWEGLYEVFRLPPFSLFIMPRWFWRKPGQQFIPGGWVKFIPGGSQGDARGDPRGMGYIYTPIYTHIRVLLNPHSLEEKVALVFFFCRCMGCVALLDLVYHWYTVPRVQQHTTRNKKQGISRKPISK